MGRYESNVDLLTKQAKKGIPVKCRICQCCFGDVEQELHFLLECPRYVTLRNKLLFIFRMYCLNKNIPYPQGHDVLFDLLMACEDEQVINGLATYIWDAYV